MNIVLSLGSLSRCLHTQKARWMDE